MQWLIEDGLSAIITSLRFEQGINIQQINFNIELKNYSFILIPPLATNPSSGA